MWDGVRIGVRTAEATFEAVRARGIPWCTFWAASYENLTDRPREERVVLNEVFASWFARLAANETVRREGVRVRVLGEWRDLLTHAAVASIETVIAATAAHHGPSLTFLVGYDGDRELVTATQALLRQATGNRQKATDVTIEELRRHAWTKDLPDVDLIIRTGSWKDPHRSANFLPLRTSNVQEAYPRIYWPDFTEADLDAVLTDYRTRERRRGR